MRISALVCFNEGKQLAKEKWPVYFLNKILMS